ncbi:ABC transporter ATP-binding protein [Micromonospora aurantiaca]|uniref:ABC transporter ATP-binding protein n=1 Tax=Micromonospora aurantiaca (nom. illeg.) TaxID=47850 RepID=UPI000F3DC22A|nr:ABC transporter ATP-binding protein [Micromonospora aurantiaca]RNH98175.1 ABC transporter ATP-binding protein [Micromonospora aurantiaca]
MPRRTTALDLCRTALGATAWPSTLLVAGALGATATALTVPPHIAAAVQAAIDGTRGRALAVAAMLLTVDTLCSLTVVWASSMISATASAALRRRMARHLLDGEPHQLHAFSGGDLVSRFVADTATIAAAVPAAVSGAAGLITAAGGLVGLTLLDPRLLAVSLVAVPAGIHLAHRNLSDLHATTLAYRRSQSELSTNLVDALRGAATIRASHTLRQETTRVLRPLHDMHQAGVRFWLAQARYGWQNATLVGAVEVCVLIAAGMGVSAGRLQATDLITAAGYSALASQLLRRTDLLGVLAAAHAAARRIDEITPPVPHTPTSPPHHDHAPTRPSGQIRLREVTVTAGNGPPLADITLDIPAGSRVALVGTTGSGRSTLAAALGGLIYTDRGTVQIDGLDLRHLPEAQRARLAAYAFEDPRLLGSTIAEAIAYGCPHEPRRSHVERAARIAAADEFIRHLPDGYDTPMDALVLSGGERQRLGIARAVAQNTPVLIIDDATTGLDSLTEARILETITMELDQRTLIVITHRQSTAAHADLVVWLDHGQVRGAGSHARLTDDPDYRRLYTG